MDKELILKEFAIYKHRKLGYGLSDFAAARGLRTPFKAGDERLSEEAVLAKYLK